VDSGGIYVICENSLQHRGYTFFVVSWVADRVVAVVGGPLSVAKEETGQDRVLKETSDLSLALGRVNYLDNGCVFLPDRIVSKWGKPSALSVLKFRVAQRFLSVQAQARLSVPAEISMLRRH
jgi:hypothetical protein